MRILAVDTMDHSGGAKNIASELVTKNKFRRRCRYFEEGVDIMSDKIERWQVAPIWTEASIGAVTSAWFEFLS